MSRVTRRKAVRLSSTELVKLDYLNQEEKFPLVVRPNIDNLNLATWAQSNRALIETQLLKHGALLFRGFNIDSAERLEEFVRAASREMLDYSEPSSPRTEVKEKIYTSTDYPADQWIQLHNEMSYAHNWPGKIFFFCLQPAESGGETPIAQSRAVYELLEDEIKERFIKDKVMYIRNYGDGLGLSWQHVFQTADKSIVEEYCRRADITFEWKNGDRLRTRQVRRAVLKHPSTGELLWFNQAHAFHSAGLAPEIRAALLAEMSEEDIPNHACYGDGSPIEDSVIARICEVYRQAAVLFQWHKGDILMLENMLMSHGRAAFKGDRKILVAMSELINDEDLNAGEAAEINVHGN